MIPGQFSGILKPDFVLPFKLSKEDAIQALKKHYLKKPLLPSTFSKANHLQEIKGVYVPFWMYDGEASGSVEFHATPAVYYTHLDVYKRPIHFTAYGTRNRKFCCHDCYVQHRVKAGGYRDN